MREGWNKIKAGMREGWNKIKAGDKANYLLLFSLDLWRERISE
jgi:hypothetical protein